MEVLGKGLIMRLLQKLFEIGTVKNYYKDAVIAEFADEHNYFYEYKGVPMPKGRRFPLKIFSEKNVAFYDVNTNKWYQLIYAKSFRNHWKIVD